jgi:DNA-binding XRE family transcriptional regulator
MIVIRCVSCGLRQYALTSICRRCHADLGFSLIEIPLPKPGSSPLMDRSRAELQLGTVIRSLRRREGISQVRLASSASVERSNLSRIESNQTTPNLTTLTRVLRTLGVESIYLRLNKTASCPKK